MRKKVKIIYGERQDNYWGGGTLRARAICDNTDHFSFACEDCLRKTKILCIRRDDRHAHQPTIYIDMYCPDCGRRGFRKMYIEDSSAFCQVGILDHRKDGRGIYIFDKEGKGEKLK